MNSATSKIYTSLLLFLLSIFLLVSIFSYYTNLSQYATTDQMEATYPRIQSFLKNRNSIDFKNGSGFSFVTVGLIGKKIDNYFASKYKLNDKITGEIYYTSALPYTFVQVTISIILLLVVAYLVCLLLQINLKELKGWIYFLLIGVVIFNLPMLKGEIKLLKYDALSLIFSLISILMYLLYRKSKKRVFLVLLAVSCAFMYIEKDTTFSVFVLLILFEFLRIQLQPGRNIDIIKALFQFALTYLGIFFITVYLFVPFFWSHPSKLFSVFNSLKDYLQALSFGIVLLLMFLAGVFFVATRYLVNKKVNIPIKSNKSNKNVEKSSYTMFERFRRITNPANVFVSVFIIGVIVFVMSIINQDNNIVSINAADESTLQIIKNKNLFVSPQMAGTSYTTMDKSHLITSVKMFFNQFRIFVYTMPEMCTILFFVSFFLLYYIYKTRKENLIERNNEVLLLFLFPILIFLSFSFLLTLPEAKYNLLPNALLSVFAICLFILFIETLSNEKWKYLCIVILGIGMIRPLAIAGPTNLGYMSLFRNAEKENSDFLNMNKYSEWTWLGWGEASYGCLNFVEHHNASKVKLIHDYLLPFHYSPTIEALRGPDYRSVRNFTNDNFRYYLQDLDENQFNLILINKNWANRDGVSNYIVKNYRDKAIYTEKIGSIEYAWLFDLKLLIKINGGNFVPYFDNKGGELYKQSKFSEALLVFRKALEIDSNNVNRYLNISACYIGLKKYNEALPFAERALKLDPTSQQAMSSIQYIKNNALNTSR